MQGALGILLPANVADDAVYNLFYQPYFCWNRCNLSDPQLGQCTLTICSQSLFFNLNP